MRLKAIVPALPVQLITALEDCGIRTDTDLLYTSGTAMQIYEKLPLGTVTLAQLEQHLQHVIEAASAAMICGEELLAQEEAQSAAFNPILTGVPQLDDIINGSNGPKVLEISGDHGTGKTVLALQVVMRHLATHVDHAALWIDTTGDFSVERMQPFITLYDDLPATHSAAERLQLSLAFDVNAIQEILDTLKSGFLPQGQMHKVRYMVIDSITPIFRPLLSIVSSQGHAMMTSFMQQLKWLADTHSMTILVLNATSSAVPQNSRSASTTNLRKPALGPSFAYMTDATLWLSTSLQRSSAPEDTDVDEDQHEVRVYVAEVLRSKYTASKTHSSFRIHDGVLHGT